MSADRLRSKGLYSSPLVETKQAFADSTCVQADRKGTQGKSLHLG